MASAQASSLQLDLWREVGRHMELKSSAPELLSLLSPHMPVGALSLIHLDRKAGIAEVVVQVERGRVRGEAHEPMHLKESECASLLRWCARRETHRSLPAVLAPLIKVFTGQELLAAPLHGDKAPIGLVVFAVMPEKRFVEADLKLSTMLLEIFSAALGNHLRLRELGTLRDTAEADRQSLLARLGRDALEDEIIGSSRGLQPVMQRVGLVASSDASVLILGETGSGKEVVARAIHAGSARASGPFIRVNCGAISPELIDSELFGHEKGSFTGAVAARRGWFERADGGTLFLDEVAELPPSAQVRLLRVLQDGRFHRVGGEQEIEVDVRIVAATHRDMAAMVQHRQFREDLWYRIAVFPIILPPLRERQGDIPELALHFARRASRRLGLPFCEPTTQDIALLRGYSWPGNVREMSSVLERAAILGQGERLAIAAALGVGAMPATDVRPTGSGTSSAVATLDQAMRDHIQAALMRTRGRVSGEHGAAVLLGINPNTLQARMRKLGLTAREFRPRNGK